MAKTAKRTVAKKATSVAKKATVPVNKDREEAMEYLRAVMKNGEDEQARVMAAIGLAQLSPTLIH